MAAVHAGGEDVRLVAHAAAGVDDLPAVGRERAGQQHGVRADVGDLAQAATVGADDVQLRVQAIRPLTPGVVATAGAAITPVTTKPSAAAASFRVIVITGLRPWEQPTAGVPSSVRRSIG
ncbi:hypothetical protein OWR29_01730 [Actinoplanes sp. Pm04-4]|uniref:Uncharacterized protein n=1 Tax=Paractinoplanes pyxinae TaxID=2997416 RepID=A0ABT4AR32_9ACTN|nr:hypothetical protein [Actinoplanes pyxinae]MCY1136700.1 hypothetical protein [Actinoplanes pyxinae]